MLRHWCADLPSQVMYQGLVEPSCASSFTATVVTAMGTDGAQRLCADYWALNSPTIRHAYLLPPEVDVEMLNFLHGADPLFSIGLRGGYMQDLMYAGLVETANFVTGHGLVQFRELSPLAYGMRRRASCARCTMLCAAGWMSA